MKIIDFVKNNNLAHFVYYRQGTAYFCVKNLEDELNYLFPVDIKDIGDATINASEKAILLMRYIRKAIESGSITKYVTS